jgi:tetratricopeptide (TPR) repeat protein
MNTESADGEQSIDERLLEERDFLLASLRDLEREREVGDIDETDYRELHDDYTRRAADVIKQLERRARENDEIVAPRRIGRRTVATVVVVALVAVSAGWLVASQSGQRLPGQSITGGIEDSTASVLSQARAINFQDPATAIELYTTVLEIDPDNIEALTYRAWLIALIAREATGDVRDAAYEAARSGLERAIALDASYADAQCFLGIVYFRFGNDAAAAKAALDTCQAMNPPAVVTSFVDAIVAEVDAALGE